MVMKSAKSKEQIYNMQSKKDTKYRAYIFSIQIIKFVSSLPEKRIYWSLGDQLLRSATSIGANIIEAQAGSSKKDFCRFFEIALKSSNETKYWLCLFRDSSLTNINIELVKNLLSEADELSKILGSSVLTMKGKRS
jgi:four helix bundle protein